MPQISQYVEETIELPGTANARISQAVIEILLLPSQENARVSQAVIELIELPALENARISQMVIELPTVVSAPPGVTSSFWADAEMMLTGVMSWTDFGD